MYEYECRACGHQFEQLVRLSIESANELLACPSCQSQNLQRLVSLFAVNSAGTRQLHLTHARKLAEPEVRDKQHADMEATTHHD